MSKLFDFNSVKEKIHKNKHAKEFVSNLVKKFDTFTLLYDKEPPLEESDWLHYYFCHECVVKLEFNINKPKEHICPSCGKIYSNSPFDGAWVKQLHWEIVKHMEIAAVLANVKDDNKKYIDYVRNMVLFYASNYDKYAIHGNHAGKGKVFPQNLTEAIFVIDLERIIRLTHDLKIFTSMEKEMIAEKFFKPAIDLIKPQISSIHNIHCWMQGAVAAAASFIGDMNLLNETIYGKWGWLEQIQKGCTEDGLWYEISPGYHFYTCNALLFHALVAYENGIDLSNEPRLKKMGMAPAFIAYENGDLPAYNDCWYGRNIYTQLPIYELFYKFYPNEEMFKNILFESYEYSSDIGTDSSYKNEMPENYCMESLLFGKEITTHTKWQKKDNIILRNSGIAILQNDKLRVSLKFTNDGGGHDHNDKLGIDVYFGGDIISSDFGTAGYGIPLTAAWYRTSAAHNMVTINHKPQSRCNAKLENWAEGSVCASTNEAYDGVELKREISILENGFKDTFSVDCSEESVIDFTFHCKGRINLFSEFTDIPNFTQGNGYDQLRNCKKNTTSDDISITWVMENSKLTLKCKAEKATEVFIADCIGYNGLDKLQILIIRRKAKSTCFKNEVIVE